MKQKERRFKCITFILLVSFCIDSCKSNMPIATNYQVVETDAAAIIADNLLPRYGGLLTQINNGLSTNIVAVIKCGVMKDSTLIGSNQLNAAILFDYHLLWRFSYDCSDKTQHIDFTGQSDYEGYNYISNDQRNGTITLTEQPSQPGYYKCGVTWKSLGKQRIKAVGANTFNSTVEFNGMNMALNQVSGEVISGTLIVKMYDTANSSFNFNGNITFLGNNKATLILNSGRNYLLSW